MHRVDRFSSVAAERATCASRSAALESIRSRRRLSSAARMIMPAPAVKIGRRIDQDEAAGPADVAVAVEDERPRRS